MIRYLLCTLMFILTLQGVLAIDVVGPLQNTHTNDTTMDFEYYLNIENPNNCSLQLNEQRFNDNTVDEGMNVFTIQNLDEGKYEWQATCNNLNTTVQTDLLTFVIDKTSPTMSVTQPGAQIENLVVELIAQDETSANLTCTIRNDGSIIDEFTVNNHTSITKNYTTTPGPHTLETRCKDNAGNGVNNIRAYNITLADTLLISTNKAVYNLQEAVVLTIDAPSDAEVTIDICPNEEGFVQCISPLVVDEYPQTITLPQNNQSGEYIVEGIATTPRGTITNTTIYTTDNTISLEITTSELPKLAQEYDLIGTAIGAVGAVTYKWTLANGTTRTTTQNKITILEKTAGEKIHNLTITDAAGNTKFASKAINIEESKEITFFVETQQGSRIQDALVQIQKDSTKYKTDVQGKFSTVVEFGTNKIYVSKQGFEYLYEDIFVNENSTAFILALTPEEDSIQIQITKPNAGAFFKPTDEVNIRFSVTGITQATVCGLFMAQSSFLEQKSTITMTQDGEQGFLVRELEEGNYSYMVECVQQEKISSSVTQNFIVSATQDSSTQTSQTPTPASTTAIADDEDPDAEKAFFEEAIAYTKNLGAKEQQLMEALELDDALRAAKRVAGQLNRDKFDLKYREDLSAAEIEAERNNYQQKLNELVGATTVVVEVLDSKTLVQYITKEELTEILEENPEILGEEVSKNMITAIHEAQQRYTMKTTVYRALLTKGDGKTQKISAVVKTLTYGQNKQARGSANERIIEIIAKSVAKDADELKIITKDFEVLVQDPVLSFPAKDSIVYYIEKDLSLDDLIRTKTFLLPEITLIDEGITGYSVFGVLDVPISKSVPLFLILAILLGAYLAYYFGLLGAAKVILYDKGPKKQTHYMRVLINDVHDNILAKNHDRALLIYKELKLSYDKLSIPAQNELYEEVVNICAELDVSYSQQLIEQMSDALKENNVDHAIELFAKIEGTFERLPEEEQEKMHEMVEGLAKKLGMEASA